jgi:integrase
MWRTTWSRYDFSVVRHIVPRIGSVRLQHVTGSTLNQLYGQLAGELLAAGTIRKTHTVLQRALRDAVRWRRVTHNAAKSADPPRAAFGSRHMRTWSPDELRAFLEHVSEDRLYPLWHLLASTGLRRGEAVGLRWIDVDLEAGHLAVRQTHVAVGYTVEVGEPKSATSRRGVALDPDTVEVLREWCERQEAEREEWGAAWTRTGLVFSREDGKALHPDRVTKLFDAHVTASGLPRIRLHDLRHTHATLALRAGVHPKVVSERLGHASVSFTLTVYSHAVPALQADAAATIARLVSPRGRTTPAAKKEVS